MTQLLYMMPLAHIMCKSVLFILGPAPGQWCLWLGGLGDLSLTARNWYGEAHHLQALDLGWAGTGLLKSCIHLV